MKVSIIIPTYNRERRIPNILRALEQQTYQDFEVIVSVDGSTDNTVKLLRESTFQLKDLKIVERPNGGRSTAKNAGVSEASGELLVFLDDDMRPEPGCIATHLLHHQKHPNSICVGTQTNDPSRAVTDIQRYRCYLDAKWERNLGNENEPLRKENLYLTSANFSIPKLTYLNIGGFDNRIGDREDYEMAIRAFRKGVFVYFNRQAFSWHDDPITCQLYVKRQRESYHWTQTIKNLKKEVFEEGFRSFEAIQLPWYKKLVFRLCASKKCVWLIDHTKVLVWLPQQARFKLYDLVITSLSRHYPEINIE